MTKAEGALLQHNEVQLEQEINNQRGGLTVAFERQTRECLFGNLA